MQLVTPDTGKALQPVEDEYQEELIPSLFKGEISKIPRRKVTGLPVKRLGLISQTLIILTEPTGRRPMLSQYTLL